MFNLEKNIWHNRSKQRGETENNIIDKKKSTSSGNDKASKFVFLFKLLNKNDA